jgi:hypothetical protein
MCTPLLQRKLDKHFYTLRKTLWNLTKLWQNFTEHYKTFTKLCTTLVNSIQLSKYKTTNYTQLYKLYINCKHAYTTFTTYYNTLQLVQNKTQQVSPSTYTTLHNITKLYKKLFKTSQQVTTLHNFTRTNNFSTLHNTNA